MKVVFPLLFTGLVLAQKPSGPAKSMGTCDVANSGSIATVNLHCTGLTPAQAKILANIPAVLNKIILNQLSPDTVLQKLDEILMNQRAQGVVIDEIKQKAAPRIMNDDSLKRITNKLSPFSGQRALLTIIDSDDEPRNFGERVAMALNAAGWRLEVTRTTQLFRGGINHGVLATVARATPAVEALIISIRDEGWEAIGELAPALTSTDIQIIVWPKSR